MIYRNYSATGQIQFADGSLGTTVSVQAQIRTVDGIEVHSGSIQFVGKTPGHPSNVSAQVATVIERSNGFDVYSKPFVFVDPTTGKRSNAFAYAEFDKVGKGVMSYAIADFDGNPLATSGDGDAKFITGAVTLPIEATTGAVN